MVMGSNEYFFSCFIDRINKIIEDKKFLKADFSFDNGNYIVTVTFNDYYLLSIIKHKDPTTNDWIFTLKVSGPGALANQPLLMQTIPHDEDLQPAPFAYEKVAKAFINAFDAVDDGKALNHFVY